MLALVDNIDFIRFAGTYEPPLELPIDYPDEGGVPPLYPFTEEVADFFDSEAGATSIMTIEDVSKAMDALYNQRA